MDAIASFTQRGLNMIQEWFTINDITITCNRQFVISNCAWNFDVIAHTLSFFGGTWLAIVWMNKQYSCRFITVYCSPVSTSATLELRCEWRLTYFNWRRITDITKRGHSTCSLYLAGIAITVSFNGVPHWWHPHWDSSMVTAMGHPC